MVDFEIAKASSESDRLTMLNTSDALEIYLRQIAAYVHHRRTGDHEAASHMLAVRAPGADTDIAPGWLVQAGSIHSKSEYQRRERAGGTSGPRPARPKADPKSKGKAKGKGGSSGAASNASG